MRLSSLPYYEKWLIMGVVIGVVAGFAAITFSLLLKLFEEIFMVYLVGLKLPRPLGEGGTLDYVFHPPKNYILISVITALGGLISGLVVYSFAPEAEGHGTDAAIRAYHYNQGKIRPIVAPVKIVASAITIGSGGSAGREGPTALFSAGIGSLIADLLHLSPEDRRIALAVGLGAGIGSIFKAPIGGAILATEILYRRDVESEVLYPALIASAIGYVLYSSVFGFTPIFGYNTESFNPITLPMYAALGLVAGLTAILYVKVFYGINKLFAKLEVPNYVKPAIGGTLTGLIALIAPEVLGIGYGWINLAMHERYSALYSPIIPPLLLIILLPFLKILATSFSVASGGSGGVFAPGLFIGAYLGAAMGIIFKHLFPNLVSDTVFVIIGMMSFFAAAGKAPIAVMLMTAEMTSNLQLLPGAMVAIAVSYAVSGSTSIYASQVPTRRDSPAHKVEYEIPVMRSIEVKACTLSDIKVYAYDSVEKVVQIMNNNSMESLPVVDNNNVFLGIVYLRDLREADYKDIVGKYVTRGSPYVTPSVSLEQVMEIMSRTRSQWLPVVEKSRFLGIITFEAIVEAYKREVSKIKLHLAGVKGRETPSL